jgi:hypothetical protein
MNVVLNFIKTAESGKLCELIDQNGNKRLVEPYMVYESATDKRLFHCYQIQGYSASNHTSGWKNIQVDAFIQATIQDKAFIARKEYNPFNYEIFPKVYFSIPTFDGRQK